MLLVHHSRNSERKLWDETLGLALGGATKVLRSHMAMLSTLDVFPQAWGEVMAVVGNVLRGSRRGTAPSATALLTSVLAAHAPPLPPGLAPATSDK